MDKRKEKIAIYLPTLVGGGAERVMLNLAQGFVDSGVDVDLVLAKTVGPYMEQLPGKINLVDLESSRTLTSIFPLIRYLRKAQPDALISALGHANLVALWAKRLARSSSKIIIGLHSSIFSLSELAPHEISLNRRLYYFLFKKFYPWSDSIIAVSNGVADDFANIINIPMERMDVVYNPVLSSELFEAAKEPVEHPWFTAKKVPLVLSVGRLSEQKNYAALIEAISVVRGQMPVRLMILGEGELREELESLVQRHNLAESVSLPGFVDNPYKYMANADLFVLSSKWEGLPTVLIETLAVGTPVVSTNCKSGPYEILEGGALGKLIPVNDVGALSDAIMASLAERAPAVSYDKLLPYEFDYAVRRYLEIVRR